MYKKFIKFVITGSVLTLVLVGCDNKNEQLDKEKIDINEEVIIDEKVDYEVNEVGLQVFDIDFKENDKIKLNPNVKNEKLENEEFLVFTYNENCEDCVKGAEVINKYVKNEKSLPIYIYDYTNEKNSDVLNYLISKGFNFTNLSSWGYFKEGVLYSSEAGNLTLEKLPLIGDYKNLKPLEVELSDDSHNKHSSEESQDH